MGNLENRIREYWTKRATGYSEVNQRELAGELWPVWLETILSVVGEKAPDELYVLDAGCGPGFFSILLAGAGCHVTAIDYTDEMIEKAKKNAGALSEKINWLQMDAQKLQFEDKQFDLVVSRNVTWNLPDPAGAYSEWIRVLKPGGKLVNFDANWYHHLFDEDKRKAYENDRLEVKERGIEDDYTCTDILEMEAIARKVPLSRIDRPQWDEAVLSDLPVSSVQIQSKIWEKLWTDDEKVNYASTPMFMVVACKQESIR